MVKQWIATLAILRVLKRPFENFQLLKVSFKFFFGCEIDARNRNSEIKKKRVEKRCLLRHSNNAKLDQPEEMLKRAASESNAA